MSLLGPRRMDSELLDEEGHDPEELRRSLAHVTAVNRRLGGLRSLRRRLAEADLGPRPRVVDVGTGNGDLLRDLISWGERGGGRWSGIGVDRHEQMLAAAQERGTDDVPASANGPGTEPHPPRILLVRADGLDLPFADDSVDLVMSTLTLHHLGDRGAVRMIREMARVSRGLVLVGELERSVANYVGALLLSATWWRMNRLTRHDGPLSVRRAFTPVELASIGREAGLVGPEVSRHPFFRLVLTGRAS